MERIYGRSIRAPCGHYYDVDCVRQLFDTATKDESLFPPSCCRRPIPFTSVWGHLPDRLQSIVEEKRREFAVQNRVYCARPSCSRFLAAQQDRTSPLRDQPSRKCSTPGCGTITCLRCKNEVKPGSKHFCADSEVDRPAIKLAKDAGWARCPGCATMIELNRGCFHMTCRCKTEFCYRCSARWKTCGCPQWEEPDPGVVPDPVDEPPRVVPIRRRRPPPPILIPPRPPTPIRIPARPPTPPVVPPNPPVVRRDRSLPMVPDSSAEREPRAVRLRERRNTSASREQRRAYRILRFPGDEAYRVLPFPGDEDEEELRRFIVVQMAPRERRPISGLPFLDEHRNSDADMPVAGPSRMARVSTDASTSSWVDTPITRDSLELPSSLSLRPPGYAHEEINAELEVMVTLCDMCDSVEAVGVSNSIS